MPHISVELSGGGCKLKGSLAHDVLGHLRDLAPLVFGEIKAASHDLLAHVLGDGATVVLGVERRVPAQHHVDDHAERPQVTALKFDTREYLRPTHVERVKIT